MSAEQINRSLPIDRIEFEGAEGRTLHARLLKWDTISRVSDGGLPYDETWKRGVFSQSIKRAESVGRGWPLMYSHQGHAFPIGVVAAVHERSDGPWMTSKISNTTAGNDALELIHDGAIPGVSVGGTNIRSRKTEQGTVERMEVAIREVSITPFPALEGSREMVLREENQPTVPRSAVDLAAFLDEIRSS